VPTLRAVKIKTGENKMAYDNPGSVARTYGTNEPQARTPPPARLSEVQEQVQRGQKLTGRLLERVKMLNERLSSVLSSGSGSQAGADSPKPTLVGHANALSNHNDQLEMVDLMLSDILDRLEL
jgi:hypothetical protein